MIIDMLASEYGWTIKEIESLGSDVTTALMHGILYRKNVKVTKLASQPTGTLASRIAEIIDTVED